MTNVQSLTEKPKAHDEYMTLNHLFRLRMLTAKYESEKASKALIELTEKLSNRLNTKAA